MSKCLHPPEDSCWRCEPNEEEIRAEERAKIVAWLRARAETYPEDIFPWPSDTPDGISAHALRRFSEIWASQIEAGEHEEA